MLNTSPSDRWSSALLLGDDYNDLGDVAIAEPAARIAVGISRGRFPKGYPHVDPNEDAVYAGDDGDTTLLAVADGHQGIDASHIAIRTISEAGRPGSQESVAAIATARARAALEAVAAAIPSLARPRNTSRTSLTVVAIRDATLAAITIGDTSCHVATKRRVFRVGEPTEFLSAQSDPDTLLPKSVTLPTPCVVIVTSDGIPDFTSDTERLFRELSQEPSRTVVERLIGAAFAGGAGDNLSVAVLQAP